MKIAMVTGSCGLVGSEAVEFLYKKGFSVIGVDNNMRKYFFGNMGSILWNKKRLLKTYPNYTHFDCDIRDQKRMDMIFRKYGKDIKLVIHAAAQPSHDWAAEEALTDFTINANGTLNLLENTRNFSPKAVFIFVSTNKVYGDTPNKLPLVEKRLRWEIDDSHRFSKDGIDETMSIDRSRHSLFGASKLAADILVQEYGRYFSLKCACFRAGCLTGPNHSGVALHGFLSYLMRCAISGSRYTLLGYKGKQVRDNMHSYDLVNAFYRFYKRPRIGEVYNIGGGRFSNCSILEAIELCEKITQKKMCRTYKDKNRKGDHIWWISNVEKFKSHYPDWNYKYGLEAILKEIYNRMVEKNEKR